MGKSSKLSQPFVSLYPHRAKPKVPVTLGFQEQNITTLHREETTKRRQQIDPDVLVWIVA